MAKEDLETKSRKAILAIKDKVTNIEKAVDEGFNGMLKDLCMKLDHVIKHKGQYYSMPEGLSYENDY